MATTEVVRRRRDDAAVRRHLDDVTKRDVTTEAARRAGVVYDTFALGRRRVQ